MRGRVSYSLYCSVRAVCGVHDLYYYVYKDNNTLWVSQFVHTTTTKGHVLHKQLLHYSIGSRIQEIAESLQQNIAVPSL